MIDHLVKNGLYIQQFEGEHYIADGECGEFHVSRGSMKMMFSLASTLHCSRGRPILVKHIRDFTSEFDAW